MDLWTSRQITEFVGIERAFEEFREADPDLNRLESTRPDRKSQKHKEWYTQYCRAADDATERFVELYREKIVVAWALRDDKEDDDGIALPPECWGPSVASLTIDKGRVEGLLLEERHKHLVNCRVVLRRKEWEKWIDCAIPDSQHGPQEPAEIPVPEEPNKEKKPQARRRGRRPQYDWALFHAEIARKVGKDPDGFPVIQADLEHIMTDWCVATWGENKCPAESTIRSQVSKYYNDDSQGR